MCWQKGWIQLIICESAENLWFFQRGEMWLSKKLQLQQRVSIKLFFIFNQDREQLMQHEQDVQVAKTSHHQAKRANELAEIHFMDEHEVTVEWWVMVMGSSLHNSKEETFNWKQCILLKNIHYGRQEGEKHLASTCKRVLRGQKNTTFFLQGWWFQWIEIRGGIRVWVSRPTIHMVDDKDDVQHDIWRPWGQ